ncbi:MAG: hypothetical protein V4543_07500 [Bacteroidota bacterium]
MKPIFQALCVLLLMLGVASTVSAQTGTAQTKPTGNQPAQPHSDKEVKDQPKAPTGKFKFNYAAAYKTIDSTGRDADNATVKAENSAKGAAISTALATGLRNLK